MKDMLKTTATGKSGRRRADGPLSPVSVPSPGVARRAYELFLERGGDHGGDLDDWLQAERELKGSRIERTNETA